MPRASKYEPIVTRILNDVPNTRRNDMLLYSYVSEELTHFNVHRMALSAVAMEIQNGELPPYETISRVRRKIQAKHPELKPSEAVQIGRSLNQDDMVMYARS